MIYRIELSRISLRRILSKDVSPEQPDVIQPETETGGSRDSATTEAMPDFNLQFEMSPHALSGWNAGKEEYPSEVVDIPVDTDDRPRITLWLTGESTGAVRPPSEKLLRDMSSAIKGLLEGYYAAASYADLFTAPCRLGWAFRRKDGSRTMTRPMAVISPNDESPLLPITHYEFYGEGVRTTTAITNRPCRLTVRPSASLPSLAGSDIVAIDIVAAQQAQLMPANLQVFNISTVSVDGSNRKAYRYNAFSAETIYANASIQNDLRIIASIPLTDLASSESIPVNLTPGALANWKLLPKFTDSTGNAGGGTTPDGPYNPDVWEPAVDLETEPLDLGMPEKRKWVVRMQLRGIFDRSAVTVTLYGSRHREDWIKVAEGKRGWVSGIASAGFRWWKVRIKGTMRRNDRLEALTFTYF